MKYFTLLTVLCLLSACGSSYPDLKLTPTNTDIAMSSQSLTEGDVTLLLPDEFSPMTDEMKSFKYPSQGAPNVIYTLQDGSVNIAVHMSTSALASSDLALGQKQLRASFEKAFPAATWFKDDLVNINGRDFIVQDFRMSARDTDIRNIMASTSHRGRLLTITFNVVSELEDEWMPVGNQVILSIHIP